MVVYGLIGFQGYLDTNLATKTALFYQYVDNPELDKNSPEYKMFGYGQERQLNYEVMSDRHDVPERIEENLQAKIIRIISYSPIITPRIATVLRVGLRKIEDIQRAQTLMDGDSIFIDQFGQSVCIQNLLVLNENMTDQDWRYRDENPELIVEEKAILSL